MKARFVVLGMVVLWLLPIAGLTAAPLLFESFETYGRTSLDANGGGANSGPSGGANPWWGPNVPNLRVTGAELGVTPHSGTNMVRGLSGTELSQPELDQDFFNLAFRLNNSNVYSGNILLDYWFFDPIGPTNADRLQSYISLAYFSNVPTNADYNDPENPGFQQQGISLGAGDLSQGADTNFYQAQVEGVTDGSYDGAGWFDTVTPRSVGWHHGRIRVSPMANNGTVNVSFYIDDMSNPTLTNSTTSAPGFNCIQLIAENGVMTAYYDDLRFYYNPSVAATLNLAVSGTNAVVTFPDLWQLQTSTNLGTTNWVTLTNVVSPYTNSVGGAQRYFRLKSF